MKYGCTVDLGSCWVQRHVEDVSAWVVKMPLNHTYTSTDQFNLSTRNCIQPSAEWSYTSRVNCYISISITDIRMLPEKWWLELQPPWKSLYRPPQNNNVIIESLNDN